MRKPSQTKNAKKLFLTWRLYKLIKISLNIYFGRPKSVRPTKRKTRGPSVELLINPKVICMNYLRAATVLQFS